MTTVGETLRELHRLHLLIQSLREDLESGPRRLRGLQARIENQQRLLHNEQDAIKHLKVDIREKEVTLQSNQQRLERHQEQLNAAASQKEFQALQQEIRHETEACKRLEDEILDMMMALEERIAGVPRFQQAVEQAQADFKAAEAEFTAGQSGVQQRLNEAETTLKQVEATLPEEPRKHYDRLLAKLGGPEAMAPLRDRRSCSNCYTEATAQQQQELKGGRMSICKSCGRLLYVPE